MKIGRETIVKGSGEVELNNDPICSNCGEECDIHVDDEGTDYEFGSIRGRTHVYVPSSDCCGADIWDGKIIVKKRSVHTSEKNHYRNGKLTVPKGVKYRSLFTRSWAVDENGEHHGFKKVEKKRLDKE